VSADAARAVVVGAGAFGAAAADALAARGWAVTLVEQFAPANARGSSGDRTRLLRLGHASWTEEQDRWYVRSARRGIAGWQELAASERADLLQRTGLVWLAREDPGPERRVAERLAAEGAACAWLAPAELAGLLPDLFCGDLAGGLLEPEALVIRAGAAVEALVRRGARAGVRLVRGRARPGARAGEVALDGGARLDADCVVWACGAWLGELLGPQVAPVRPAWQEVLHWSAPPAWREGPAWFDEHAGHYGLPDVDGLGIKAVTHVPGPPFDLERDPRIPTAAGVRELGAYVAHRFPALAGAGLLWGRVMPYEMTPDHHFVLGPSPAAERTWVLGGGSGHGFKHAPALAEHLADRIEGRAEQVPWLRAGARPAPAGSII
jgi:glycine/D-amino acid oxidase-like deaminating enzyme